MRISYLLLGLFTILTLTGCGGGGGSSSDTTATVTPELDGTWIAVNGGTYDGESCTNSPYDPAYRITYTFNNGSMDYLTEQCIPLFGTFSLLEASNGIRFTTTDFVYLTTYINGVVDREYKELNLYGYDEAGNTKIAYTGYSLNNGVLYFAESEGTHDGSYDYLRMDGIDGKKFLQY
jgi:hypothetical protein